MPDTTEQQSEFPVERLLKEVEQWNLSSKKSYEVSFSWGVAAYITGTDYAEVLRVVDRAYLLEAGTLRASGGAAELLQSETIREAYLGV